MSFNSRTAKMLDLQKEMQSEAESLLSEVNLVVNNLRASSQIIGEKPTPTLKKEEIVEPKSDINLSGDNTEESGNNIIAS